MYFYILLYIILEGHWFVSIFYAILVLDFTYLLTYLLKEFDIFREARVNFPTRGQWMNVKLLPLD